MTDTLHRPSILTISDEWAPTRGGVSQFNRRFAIALAEQGYPTACLVQDATPIEREDARAHHVTLFTAVRIPSGPDLSVRVQDVVDWRPDIIIGHDVVSGKIAWIHAHCYVPAAALGYVAHTAPSQNEPYKHVDAAARVSDREREMREIAADATIVAAVGPLLTRRTKAVVGDLPPGVLRLDPGLDVLAGDARRSPPANPIVLMLSRTTHIEPKGIDIAASAIAGLRVAHGRPLPELRIRGAHGERCDSLRGQLVQRFGVARDRLDVRAYSADPTEIANDLRQAALYVMPSRVEGFGLAGLEAIGLGTPVLISDRSGLAELVVHHLGRLAEPMIVRVHDDLERDTANWRAAIERTMDNLDAAFDYAHDVRTRLAGVLRWDLAVHTLMSGFAARLPDCPAGVLG